MKIMSTHLTIVTPFKEKEFSLTESLSSCIKDVKLNLSRLLNTPVTAIRLELEDDELVDEDTLEEVGCLEDGNTEMKMTIFLPLGDTEVKEFTERQGLPKSDNKKGQAEAETESFDSFLQNQPLNRRPKLIYEPEPDLVEKDEKKSAMNRYKKKNQYHIVECELADGTIKEVKVEIDHMFGKKPFLGGFRHKLTKKEYHHAFSQTAKAVTGEAKEAKMLISRHIQTRPEMDKEEQTSSEKATQVPRMGLYVLKENDKVLPFSGHYMSAEEMERKYMFNVMFVQRVCRGWIARKKVAKMREVYAKQKDQEEDDRRLKSEEQYLRKVEEAKRCENPKTKADFDMLYNKLEEWRKNEEEGIQVKDARTLNVSRAKLVMQEAKMLSKISMNKNIANLEAKENTIREFLSKASSPHCWSLSDGGSISIVTPDTQRALELQNLYIRLKCDDVIPEERILVLNDLKDNVVKFDCKLTREIADLVDRETDLMERGVKHANLSGLRQRILHLYLQYVRTPMFNPEARRYTRLALPDPPQPRQRGEGRSDIEYCQSCSQFKPRTYFNMSAGSASLAQCQACRRLDNDARTRLDLSLYKSLLDNIKAEEEARQNLASPAFILQESDIRFIVENIWNSRSILSGLGDLFDLRLARWECEKEWSPWNCILLSREECRIHTQLGGLNSAYPTKEDLVKAYGPLLVEKIVSKHTLAKKHFAKMASMTKFFEDLDKKNSNSDLTLNGKGIKSRS